MKPSKKVRQALKDLKIIKEIVEYAYGGREEFNTLARNEFKRIEDTLISLAEDKKLFGIKLKKMWDEEAEKISEEV